MGLSAAGSLYKPFVMVDEPHERIERGHAFQHDNVHSIGGGADSYHLIRVGQYPAHLMTLAVEALAGPFELEMTESPTLTGIGTLAAVINKNRNSPLTSDTLVYEGAITFTAAGTHIESELGPSTVLSAGNKGSLGINWKLKANTDYLVRMTNNAVGATQYSFHAMFYEDRKD